jgi:sporulation protein YlmC with PRC-barrel domain
MVSLVDLSEDERKEFMHHDVVDEKEHKVGSVQSIHIDEETGKSDFILVSTGWLFGHLFLVPVAGVQVSPDRKRLQLPFDREFIEAAPTLHSSKVVTLTDTTLALRYFLGGVSEFTQEDLGVDTLNRPRRPPGYDPNDTGLTGN